MRFDFIATLLGFTPETDVKNNRKLTRYQTYKI